MAGVFFFSSRHEGDGSAAMGAGVSDGNYPVVFEGFVERWNKEMESWLAREVLLAEKEIGRIDSELRETKGEQASFLTRKKVFLNERLRVFRQILKDGPSILELGEKDLPDGLVWEDGKDEPDIGDARAVKGGGVNLWNPTGFPFTLRRFGPSSRNYFNYSLYDNVDMRLVYIHPQTGRMIRGLASEWAVGGDGRTVFFRIDPKARYSDGVPVKARDFLLNICLMTSVYAADPYYMGVFRKDYSAVRTYGEGIVSVTLPNKRPLLPYMASRDFFPANPVFYAKFDAAFPKKYQWKAAPTTGGYTVAERDVVKGRMITMRRVADWWAKDLKFFRNTCNVDSITHHFIDDENRAVELFRRGEIDAVTVHKPELWNEKLEIPEVHAGYIRRVNLETVYPKPPFGLFINAASGCMKSEDVRKGFHHAMNMGLVLDRVFQGDMRRAGSYAEGYGALTNTDVKAREYSPEMARKYFARAGYTRQGDDGILMNEKGERLVAELSYADMSDMMTVVSRLLKQYARVCGLDLKLDPMESSVCSRKVFEKRHQVAFWAWPLAYPLPELFNMFHSSLAFDDRGRLIPNTDNIVSSADGELDRLLMLEKTAETSDEFRRAAWDVQQKVHELAVWVPGWVEPYARAAFWRWVKWPDSARDGTRFCYPAIYDPLESHLYWIEPGLREETLEARSKGVAFPEREEFVKQEGAGEAY